MGRGRQKAKQKKMARKLKYLTTDTDYDELAKELNGQEPGSGSVDPFADVDDQYEHDAARHSDYDKQGDSAAGEHDSADAGHDSQQDDELDEYAKWAAEAAAKATVSTPFKKKTPVHRPFPMPIPAALHKVKAAAAKPAQGAKASRTKGADARDEAASTKAAAAKTGTTKTTPKAAKTTKTAATSKAGKAGKSGAKVSGKTSAKATAKTKASAKSAGTAKTTSRTKAAGTRAKTAAKSSQTKTSTASRAAKKSAAGTKAKTGKASAPKSPAKTTAKSKATAQAAKA